MTHAPVHPSEIESSDGLLDDRLKPQIERLQALRSAWSVLAPSCFGDRGREIAESGRAVTDRIAVVAGRSGPLEAAEITSIDVLLDEFETSMRLVAAQVEVAQFRATLPAILKTDRQGLLDLLDVMIGGIPDGAPELGLRIGAIDYLVTLLCTNAGTSGGTIRYDPVGLTARLANVCASAHSEDDPRLVEIEAEFFAASSMDLEELREEIALRKLRSRKVELGKDFFCPRILRAIVTYNAALLDRVAHELLDSSDWGQIDGASASRAHPGSGSTRSVFECEPLQRIADATRRRALGEPARNRAEDRIAWALDFDYLDPPEHRALRSDDLARAGDPLGTAILVGLLCRSLAVLAIELQTAGISPDEVSEEWVSELDAVFRNEINARISGDAYKAACALSELKNKFLLAPLTPRRHEPTPTPTRAATAADGAAQTTASPSDPRRSPPHVKPKRETARDLVRSALDEGRSEITGAGRRTALRDLLAPPMLRLALIGGVSALLLFGGYRFATHDSELVGWNRDQLEQISSYLERGHRNGAGTGSAFVGRVGEAWEALTPSERERRADELVGRLREAGVRQIMIYDADDALRIQSLGSQPTRIR